MNLASVNIQPDDTVAVAVAVGVVAVDVNPG